MPVRCSRAIYGSGWRTSRATFYADITVVCGALRLQPGSDDVVENPSVIVEVLSSSTEQYDRGLKWEGYRRIASLNDYLLVAQSVASIEHYRRQADGSWLYRAVGPGERVVLTGGAELAVEPIFEGVFELAGE